MTSKLAKIKERFNQDGSISLYCGGRRIFRSKNFSSIQYFKEIWIETVLAQRSK